MGINSPETKKHFSVFSYISIPAVIFLVWPIFFTLFLGKFPEEFSSNSLLFFAFWPFISIISSFMGGFIGFYLYRYRFKNGSKKILWTLIIVLILFISYLVYAAIPRAWVSTSKLLSIEVNQIGDGFLVGRGIIAVSQFPVPNIIKSEMRTVMVNVTADTKIFHDAYYLASPSTYQFKTERISFQSLVNIIEAGKDENGFAYISVITKIPHRYPLQETRKPIEINAREIMISSGLWQTAEEETELNEITNWKTYRAENNWIFYYPDGWFVRAFSSGFAWSLLISNLEPDIILQDVSDEGLKNTSNICAISYDFFEGQYYYHYYNNYTTKDMCEGWLSKIYEKNNWLDKIYRE